MIELSPDWVEAHINLGVALYHQRRLDDAQRSFLAALALDPANAICRYNLGCVYEEAGKIDEAIENLRCAIRRCRITPTRISIWRWPMKRKATRRALASIGRNT